MEGMERVSLFPGYVQTAGDHPTCLRLSLVNQSAMFRWPAFIFFSAPSTRLLVTLCPLHSTLFFPFGHPIVELTPRSISRCPIPSSFQILLEVIEGLVGYLGLINPTQTALNQILGQQIHTVFISATQEMRPVSV